MKIPYLAPTNDQQVHRHSSIYQNRNTLCVMKKGEWCPIAFDRIIGISCGKIKTRKSALTDKPTIGYQFKVAECKYISDVYVKSQINDKRVEELNTWFGVGFYDAIHNNSILINSDNGSLGEHNTTTHRVGLDYVLADRTLPSAE